MDRERCRGKGRSDGDGRAGNAKSGLAKGAPLGFKSPVEVREAFRRMENPPFYVHGYLASCLAMLGDEAGAAAERKRLYAARPDFDLDRFTSIFPYRNPETAHRFFATFGEAGIS